MILGPPLVPASNATQHDRAPAIAATPPPATAAPTPRSTTSRSEAGHQPLPRTPLHCGWPLQSSPRVTGSDPALAATSWFSFELAATLRCKITDPHEIRQLKTKAGQRPMASICFSDRSSYGSSDSHGAPKYRRKVVPRGPDYDPRRTRLHD